MSGAGPRSRLQGDFSLNCLLGAGAYGAVVQCTNRLDQQAYAIKISDFDDGGALKEVQNLVKVPPHENVVRYFGCWVDEFLVKELNEIKNALKEDANHEMFRVPLGSTSLRVLCIQMELCQHNLREWLGDNPVVDEEKAINIFIQLTKGLQHLHTNKVIHRDLKPENIFLVGHLPTVKIGDLGVSTTHVGTKSALHSRTGTPFYFAPEQAKQKYGYAIDLFALGLIFYEILHPQMQPKVSGDSWDELIEAFDDLKIDKQLPPHINAKWPHAAQLIVKLTARNPKDRPNYEEIFSTFAIGSTAFADPRPSRDPVAPRAPPTPQLQRPPIPAAEPSSFRPTILRPPIVDSLLLARGAPRAIPPSVGPNLLEMKTIVRPRPHADDNGDGDSSSGEDASTRYGTRLYKCAVCDECQAQVYVWHHCQTCEKEYQYDLCTSCYKNRRTCRTHNLEHHFKKYRRAKPQ